VGSEGQNLYPSPTLIIVEHSQFEGWGGSETKKVDPNPHF